MSFDVHKDGTWDQTVEYVVRVQSDDAKVNSSVFTIDYNSATDKVEVIDAYTKNGRTITKVPATSIEDRDRGESRDYDALKVRSIVYPQVEVGSELYLKYKVATNVPITKDRWSTLLEFSPGMYIKDLRVDVKSEVPVYYELQDPRRYVRVSKKGTNGLQVTNRKPLPGWVHAEKEPYFHPAGFTRIYISTEKDWRSLLGGLEKDYEKIISQKLPHALAGWVKDAQKKKTASEKMLVVLEKLSRVFRYFGDWRRHDGGFVPRPLAEIESSRYGDCKDLSSLTVAMLRSAGLDAHVALVRRGENPWGREPDYGLPVSYRFNHAIVNVKADGKDYWLDPTNPVASLEPFPDISGRPAWVMRAEGGQFVRIPEAQAEDFDHEHVYTYKFNGDDDVRVKVKAALKRLAPYRIANDLMLSSRSEVLSSTLEYFTEGQQIYKYKFVKEPKTSRVLQDMYMELDYTAGKVAYNAGKAKFWVLPDGFLEGEFYETENRESDLRLAETPFTFNGIRRLQATQLAQQTPDPCHVESKWVTLDRRIHSDKSEVVIEQKVVLKRPYITKEEFGTKDFRRLQTDAKKCFHRSGILIESKRG